MRRWRKRPEGVPTLEQMEAELRRVRKKRRIIRWIRNTIFVLIIAAAATVLVAMLILPVFQITGSSMENTLLDGDTVVVWRNSDVRTGDIIAFYHNNTVLIKRVIAHAGDVVDIDEEGVVYVNGQPLEESYVAEKELGRCDIELPCTVPEGRLFVMGDHRSVSIDSRSSSVGCIKESSVVGPVLLRLEPLRNFGLVK